MLEELETKNDVKKTKKYSGLNNQGSTCYMNSLIQTLFMTAEFRIKLLNWVYNKELHGSKEDSIVYQLQKLLAKLHLKSQITQETKDLTKSFQWNNKEVLVQHDIQEFYKVILAQIENVQTDLKLPFIGQMEISIKCLNCSQISINKEEKIQSDTVYNFNYNCEEGKKFNSFSGKCEDEKESSEAKPRKFIDNSPSLNYQYSKLQQKYKLYNKPEFVDKVPTTAPYYNSK